MKNLLYLICFSLILAACGEMKKQAQVKRTDYIIQGTIAGYNGKVFLMKREAGAWITLDSASTGNGNFTFKGNIGLPEMYYITNESEEGPQAIFVEPADIRVKWDTNGFSVAGSKSQMEYKAYLDLAQPFEKRYEEVEQKYREADEKKDEKALEQLDSVYTAIDNDLAGFILRFAMENNKTVVSPYILTRNFYRFEADKLEPVARNFDSTILQSVYTKRVTDRVEILKRVAIGQPAVDFTLNDQDGKPVQLSSLFGKTLLIDFWASWCGPCRAENPNVVAAWKKYNKKGFDILGVSLDNDREKWIEAIAKDNLTWKHVSDLKGWGSAAAEKYGVNSIPANVLLDEKGTIIARNLRGENLEAKLAELFSPQLTLKSN